MYFEAPEIAANIASLMSSYMLFLMILKLYAAITELTIIKKTLSLSMQRKAAREKNIDAKKNGSNINTLLDTGLLSSSLRRGIDDIKNIIPHTSKLIYKRLSILLITICCS